MFKTFTFFLEKYSFLLAKNAIGEKGPKKLANARKKLFSSGTLPL